MDYALTIALAVAFCAVASLYASVGHGGASGYLAVMALAGMAPAVMRPTALGLNLAVAGLAAVAFARAGYFRWRLFWPFAATSIPFAWLGGGASVSDAWFRLLVGGALFVAALRFFLPAPASNVAPRAPPVALALWIGVVLGYLSGLVGVGGGIFLTPLLLLAGWARPKEAAAVSAPFIFVNSLAGLIGLMPAATLHPPTFGLWIAATLVGGLLGARLGSERWPQVRLRQALGAVLLVASTKFVLMVFA